MCDFVGGQVIVTRPRGDGPAAAVASAALGIVNERYGVRLLQRLDNLMEEPLPFARKVEGHERTSEGKWAFSRPPFHVELAKVRDGDELSFVDELRGVYFDFALSDRKTIADLVHNRDQQLHASPNWKLYTAAGTPEAVPDPFRISGNHPAYLRQVGLHTAMPKEAAGITVAVLDNGFDSTFWRGSPTPSPVATSQDLISGDSSTSGHGTLVAALIAESAPGANVVPLRMAGQESTEWDALHALARAVQLGAHVVTFSYRQILAADNPCKLCGFVRRAARSEVFAKMIDWASDGGRRAILAAAGNDGIGSIARPAAYQGAIPIAALDSHGTALWSASNWDAANKLDVLALPGEDVASGTTGALYSGTSFATAYAAALYAVAMGRNNITDATQVSIVLTAPSARTVSNARVPVLI
jgi:hypothetical protein